MQTAKKSPISKELLARFLAAKRVIVLTGAGVSAESGVPTFRGGGASSMWKGMPFEVVSSAQMAERDLPTVWEWFDHRRGVLRTLQPNPAHVALARWPNYFEDFTLVTQNVDDLHQCAGSKNVLELHGNIWRARCIDCQTRLNIPREGNRPEACLDCGGNLRPDVVLFGELLPAGVFELAAEKAAGCEICFVVGTSAVVYPAAALPEIAAGAGSYVCEINPERTPLSDLCDETLTGQAGDLLPLFTRGN